MTEYPYAEYAELVEAVNGVVTEAESGADLLGMILTDFTQACLDLQGVKENGPEAYESLEAYNTVLNAQYLRLQTFIHVMSIAVTGSIAPTAVFE